MNRETSPKHSFGAVSEQHKHEINSQGESIIGEVAAEFGVKARCGFTGQAIVSDSE